MKFFKGLFWGSLISVALWDLISLLILALVNISGCGSSSIENKKRGHVPVIIEVIFTTDDYVYITDYIETTEYFYIYIIAKDPGLDISNLILYAYHPSTSGTPYFGPVSWPIYDQSAIIIAYFGFLSTGYTGPTGWWRFEFQLEDRKGNESNIFKIDIYVTG